MPSDMPRISVPRRLRLFALSLLLIAVAPGLAGAQQGGQDAAGFFKGKTVIYVVATAAGGGYDLYGRLAADYMQKYLSGSTFVVRNMPGAGHMIGANFIGAARADGLTMGIFNTGLIYTQLAGIEGLRIDLNKMSWIGKAGTDPRALVMAAQTPYKTMEDVRRGDPNFKWAGSGVGSAAYMELKLLIDGLKLPGTIITGYNGNDDRLAMRRGEIQGTIGSYSSYEDFVNNGYGRFVAQIGGKNDNVPQLRDVMKDAGPDVRAAIALIQSQGEIGRLTAGPPGIPADRLAALRAAYKKALEDPELRDKAMKAGRPIEPAYGEELAAMIRESLDQPPATVALLKAALGEGEAKTARADGPLLEVRDKGREIVFKGPQGDVAAKPSGSRTVIKIAGKDGKREDLRPGLACVIDYTPGGDNEPALIDCK